jgi:hypothetical protein
VENTRRRLTCRRKAMNSSDKKIFKIIQGIGFLVLIIQIFYLFTVGSYDYISTKIVEKDIIAFITGATILKNGDGHLLYDRGHQLEVQNEIVNEKLDKVYLAFISPPVVAGMFLPATVTTDLYIVFKTYYVILILSLIAVLTASISLFYPDIKSFLIPLIFFIYLPVYTSVMVGQLTPILLLALVAIYFLIKKERTLSAGAISSLFMIKAHFLILPVYLFFLLKRDKRFLAGFLSGSLILTAVNFILSPSFITEYPKMLFKVTNVETSLSIGTRIQNNLNLFNFYPLIGHWINNNIVSLIMMGLAVVALNIFALYFIPKLKDFEIAFSLSVLASLVFNIHTLSYDFLLFLFPILLLVKHYVNKKLTRPEILFVFLMMVGLYIVPLFQQRLTTMIMLLGFFYILGTRYSAQFTNPTKGT